MNSIDNLANFFPYAYNDTYRMCNVYDPRLNALSIKVDKRKVISTAKFGTLLFKDVRQILYNSSADFLRGQVIVGKQAHRGLANNCVIFDDHILLFYCGKYDFDSPIILSHKGPQLSIRYRDYFVKIMCDPKKLDINDIPAMINIINS